MQPLNLPYEFVNFLIKPGLECDAGVVKLNQYMCKSIGNGGNDNAAALLGPLRWMKEGGKGTILNKSVGGFEIDVMQKGQGDPASTVMVWDFMVRNQAQLKSIKLKVVRRPPENRQQVVIDKSGNVYDLYFNGRSPAAGLQLMVKDRFFGLDCIGFVANYLIFVGEWDKYYGFEISQWDSVFKKNIKKAADVQPCQILLWGGHVALVDWVHRVDGDVAIIDVCQSSSGGPQCNERVVLTRTSQQTKNGYQLFKIEGGTPVVPVGGYVHVHARPGFSYEP